jgi:hypothetical protein
MKILRVLLAFALVVTGVASTVGSGGGGGGGTFDGVSLTDISLPDPPLFSWVNITATNAQDVSATVVHATDHMFDIATTMGGQIFPSFPAAPELLSSHSKFELFETVVATGEPITDTCAVSGTVTVSGSPANDPVTIAVGDVFVLVFDACDDGDGYTIDSSFSLKVMELVGDPGTDVFRLRYALLDMSLTVASSVDSYTASDSEFQLICDSLAFPVIVLTTGAESLQLSSQADVYSWNFGVQAITVNTDISPITTLREARESRMKSDLLGDYLYYKTIMPLQGADNQNPESGEILISGNGTVRIVIESSASVRLEIDADGDGTIDDFQYTTWAALQG